MRPVDGHRDLFFGNRVSPFWTHTGVAIRLSIIPLPHDQVLWSVVPSEVVRQPGDALPPRPDRLVTTAFGIRGRTGPFDFCSEFFNPEPPSP